MSTLTLDVADLQALPLNPGSIWGEEEGFCSFTCTITCKGTCQITAETVGTRTLETVD